MNFHRLSRDRIYEEGTAYNCPTCGGRFWQYPDGKLIAIEKPKTFDDNAEHELPDDLAAYRSKFGDRL